MSENKLTGKIARERIRLMQVPRPPEGLIDEFKSLGDASGIISDIMDELGIVGVASGFAIRADHSWIVHRRACTDGTQHHAARACL